MGDSWTSIDIAGKEADLYEPAGGKPRFGIIHLHGLSGETLRNKPIFSQLFEEWKLACLCPHGGRSWWGDRLGSDFDPQITPEKYLIQNILPFFRDRWGLAPRFIGLQGASMGGQGALRLAFKHADLFPVVAGIASALDYHELYDQEPLLQEMYDSKEQCRQDTALLHVPPVGYPPHIFFCIDPDDERWLRGNDRLHEKLNALGIPHEYDGSTRGGGHSWEYFNHVAERAVRFIHAGLELESRRLL